MSQRSDARAVRSTAMSEEPTEPAIGTVMDVRARRRGIDREVR